LNHFSKGYVLRGQGQVSISMAIKSKSKVVQEEKGSLLSVALSLELRGWITRVMVPILIEQFLQQKSLQAEEIDG
jgi:hypothetical protein